jgi:hypothetical protein
MSYLQKWPPSKQNNAQAELSARERDYLRAGRRSASPIDVGEFGEPSGLSTTEAALRQCRRSLNNLRKFASAGLSLSVRQCAE